MVGLVKYARQLVDDFISGITYLTVFGSATLANNDPAFKVRGFSVFVKVKEIISYLKVKIAEPIPESALKRLLYPRLVS